MDLILSAIPALQNLRSSLDMPASSAAELQYAGYRNMGMTNATRPAALAARSSDLQSVIESPETDMEIVYPVLERVKER